MRLEEFKERMRKTKREMSFRRGACSAIGHCFYGGQAEIVLKDFACCFRYLTPSPEFLYWLGPASGAKDVRAACLDVFEEVAILAEFYKDY